MGIQAERFAVRQLHGKGNIIGERIAAAMQALVHT
jgi:hypothetical protein